MAQQTINVGTAPNDGTGTPLRTAFQYTNSNFSELYTAVGPSGNNIVVPGSATITGDLTVRTNVISATSSGVGFGINTAAAAIDVVSSFQWRSNTGGTDKLAIFSGGAGLIYLGSTTASALSFLYNGSTAMTLNATGLGVGTATHSTRLGVVDAGNTFAATFRGNGGTNFVAIGTTGFGASINGYTAGFASAADLVLQPNGGNVGIGVTPSAWDAGFQVIENSGGSLWSGSTGAVRLSQNAYYATGLKYKNALAASQYVQTSGQHQWFNAPSGTAGTAITFTQAMTLDASGNLLVAGTSAYIRAGGRTQIVGGSVVDINTVGNNVGIAFGGASSILPCDGSSTTTDGVANFGSASKRWNTIYASTGTINTSDQNEKQDIADLGDAEKRVAGKIKSLVKRYRFKDAVASKGENARIHVGWIAQDIQNAFSSEGLDASKYGVFCSDTWEENGVQKTRLGLRYDEVLAFVVSAI